MKRRLSKGTVPIYYLKKGEIAKVYNGTYKICGHRADGSIISETEVRSLVTGTQWRIGSHDASIGGTSLLKGIFGASPFTYPKSLYAVHDTLRFFVNDKPNALVIDFFGGSGTTLHAVNLLNAEDQGHRKCILVTNNEISEDEEISLTAQGLRPTDQKWDDLGIARYVTWPRTVCSIEGHDIKRKPLKGNYGCPIETYQGYDGYIVDPETGKKKRKKLFEKVKKPFYPELADHKMSDGFEENAIFFDLEYLEPSVVSADLAFDRIAPILWLAGGCKGEILQRQKGYVIGETYAVLFDPRYTTRFVDAVSENKEIKTVFIVTDAAERYRSLCAELPGCRVMQLYLNDACKTLVQSTALWQMYCEQNDAPMVRPLMVVQVPNKISQDKIRQICSEIYEKIPSLDRSTAFAHVISGEGDMYLAPYEVPCVEPQDVQRKSDIRVLFAKEAISTGWDCPRAEVIFSMRPHQDDTYIAQLIGRMVRTPLAESVNIELLNAFPHSRQVSSPA